MNRDQNLMRMNDRFERRAIKQGNIIILVQWGDEGRCRLPDESGIRVTQRTWGGMGQCGSQELLAGKKTSAQHMCNEQWADDSYSALSA